MISFVGLPIMCFFVLGVAAYPCPCDPGYYCWIYWNGLEHCRLCPAGCACPGGLQPCIGCSGGWFSPAAGESACSVCPAGTTSDIIFNGECNPFDDVTPCENFKGPLGLTSCRPIPPPPAVIFRAPRGAVPPQNPLVPLLGSY
jgi:hypothetical protein